MPIRVPSTGEDSRELWRVVADLARVVNALEQMQVSCQQQWYNVLAPGGIPITIPGGPVNGQIVRINNMPKLLLT